MAALRAILHSTMTRQEPPAINPNSTRWMVVKALRTLGIATVTELADAVAVKAVTVRHHLNSLQAAGLVDVEEQRQPVGRPVYVYTLTAQAERLFPQAYHLLVDRLLEQVKDKLDRDTIEMLIAALVDSMANDIRKQIAHLSPEAQRKRLVEWMNQNGLTARWRESSDGLQLVKYYCPYHAVAHHHPELCQIDEALIQAALDTEVERSACLRDGDQTCTLLLHDDSGHIPITEIRAKPK